MTTAVMSLSKINHREHCRRSVQGSHEVSEVCLALAGHYGTNNHCTHRP